MQFCRVRVQGKLAARCFFTRTCKANFDLALENGFDNVETDVQLSSDGCAVLIHDDTLHHTTNGSGVVTETTFADIKALSAGDWFQGPDDSVGLKEPSNCAHPNAR